MSDQPPAPSGQPAGDKPKWFEALLTKGETMPELLMREPGETLNLTRPTPATQWILETFTPAELAGQMLFMLMKQRVVRLDYETGLGKGQDANARAALLAEKVAIRKAKDSERRQQRREAQKARSGQPKRVRAPQLQPNAISTELISYWSKHRRWPRTVDEYAEFFNWTLVEVLEEKAVSKNTIYRQVAREEAAGLLVWTRRKYSDKKWRVSLRLPLEREKNLRERYPAPADAPVPLELDAPAPQPAPPPPLALANANDDEPL